MITLSLLFLQNSISWPTVINITIGVIIFLLAVVSAIILFLSKNKETIHETDKKRADASEGLLKVRDIELEDCDKRCNKCKEELEDVTAELRAKIAVDVDKLFAYWQIREVEQAKMGQLESDNRVLRYRLGDK